MKAGDVIADRFEIERLAGSGGMGAVYRAVDRQTGSFAALKVLWSHFLDLPEHAERFAREAQVLQELHHPGIVRYIAHGTTGAGEPWLALEWLEGESLGQRLRRKGLTVGESVALGRRVADALAAAHRRGIVHRDLKPSNLYLLDQAVERPKLLDFGIARVAGGAPITMTGVVIGTPFYMAPEQARGDKHVDARADVFALGCVLFHCLVGRAPFAGEEVHAALLRVVLEDAPRLSSERDDIPDALDALVARMLAKSPDDRPDDAADVAEQLEALGSIGETDPAPVSLRASALTGRELRIVCAVLARIGGETRPVVDSPTQPMTLPDTLPMWERDPRRKALEEAIARHHAKLEALADGAMLVTLGGLGEGTDQAARAARCALAIHAVIPEAPMAVVAGRGTPTARMPAGEVLDRGIALLDARPAGRRSPAPAGAPPGADVRIDEIIAGLLGARFDVGGDAAGLFLRGEREIAPAARTLLGRPTPFVGRDHELGALEAALDECADEPCSRAVLVTAAAGIGKSRLLHELMKKLQPRRAGAHGTLPPGPAVQVWTAQGDPMSAGSPFGMLGQMLRREAGVREGEPREVRQQKLRARVARHVLPRDVARVTWFLGELSGVPFSEKESVELRAARHDPVLMGDQMRRAFDDLLLAECATGPMLLVLEDLHWGDLPTVKVLDASLRNLRERPLLVLALARPEIHDLFPKLWVDRGVSEIHLRELGRRGSEKLVREVLGDVAPDVLDRIVDRAAGNAFYLEELIRAAADGTDTNLPETVLAMVEARLEALHPEARRVLRAASVFGQVFWRGGVLPLLGGEKAAPLLGDWLSDLVDRELVARRGEGKFPGEEEYAFRHAIVRDAAYATLTPGDRELGHKLAASFLEREGEREPLLLAEHFERGGEPERAVRWFRRAAEQALEGDDFAASIERAERGAAYASGEVLGGLRLLQAEAYKWMGSAAEAERCAEGAMQRLTIGSPLWYVAASEAGSMRLRLGRHDELAALAEEVRASGLLAPASSEELVAAAPSTPRRPFPSVSSLPPPPSMGVAVSAVARLAGSLLHDGQHALAEALIAEIDRVAAPLAERDFTASARIYALHASRALCYGDPASALRFTELSIPSFACTGDRRNACLGRVNAAHAVLQLGDERQAERALRSALADADRMGLANVSALARQNLAPALGRQGALDEAAAVAGAAIAAFEAQSNRRQEGRGRVYLAAILAARGDLDTAEREARAAAHRLASIPPLRVLALGVLAGILLARGDSAGSLASAREAVDALLALGTIEEGEALVRLVYAEALAASGNGPAASDALEVAERRLLARAARIADPGWRASFLSRVPENARTLDLARARDTGAT